MSKPLNYSTKISARCTAGECLDLLAEAGADAVHVQYQDKRPAGLGFRLNTPHGVRDFMLPVNIDGVAVMIQIMLVTDKPHVSRSELDRLATKAHAADVGWRVLRDWLEAQLAIIAAGMVRLEEVMMPYMEVAPGRSLWTAYLESHAGRIAIER